MRGIDDLRTTVGIIGRSWIHTGRKGGGMGMREIGDMRTTVGGEMGMGGRLPGHLGMKNDTTNITRPSGKPLLRLRMGRLRRPS